MLLFPKNEPIANSFQVAYYFNSFCIPQVQNRPQNSELKLFSIFSVHTMAVPCLWFHLALGGDQCNSSSVHSLPERCSHGDAMGFWLE